MAPDVALRELAGKVALRLVAEALEQLAGPRASDIVIEALPRLALPAASKPRAGRKPGVKLKRGRPRKAAPQTSAVRCPARKCQKADRVHQNADGSFSCAHCHHTWRRRGRPSTVEARKAPGPCVRCDHEESAHVGENGKCLTPRCVCREFYS